MFTAELQAWGRRVAEFVVRPLAIMRVSPNVLTVLGLILNVVVATTLAVGPLRIGGLLLLLAGGFDMLDGALARVTQTFSTFGAFLDSVLDRYSEAIVGGGLLYALLLRHDVLGSMLLFVLVLGSFMISYTRARAEGLGIECTVGLLPRPERIIILAVGLLFNVLIPVLALLALLTQVTAMQRLFYVWRAAQAKQSSAMQHEGAVRHSRDD